MIDWLDFVCVGPKRCATTWLDHHLRNIKPICLPKNVKETFFFDQRYSRGTRWYRDHFRHCDSTSLKGEIGPSYFHDEKAAHRLGHISALKVVSIIIRNPVDRALSLHRHHYAKGRVSNSLQEAVEQKPEILEGGRYSKYIPLWASIVGNDVVQLTSYNTIAAHPQRALVQFLRQLGVDSPTMNRDLSERINEAPGSQFRSLHYWATQMSRVFRSAGLDAVVEFAKRWPVKSFLESGAQLDNRTPATVDWLRQYYSNDLRYLQEIGFEVDPL